MGKFKAGDKVVILDVGNAYDSCFWPGQVVTVCEDQEHAVEGDIFVEGFVEWQVDPTEPLVQIVLESEIELVK